MYGGWWWRWGGGNADSKAVTVAHLNQGNTSLTVSPTIQDNLLNMNWYQLAVNVHIELEFP